MSIMIFANGFFHAVDVEKQFTPKYNRALKFITSMNGKVQVSDRGEPADTYECTFTVIGSVSDMAVLVTNLYLEKGQILLELNFDAPLFGTGLDYSNAFTCNLLNIIEYPLRDQLTTTITLKVKVVSPILYNIFIPDTLPTLFYEWPIRKRINKQKSPFQSIAIGDFGNSTRVDNSNIAIKSERVIITVFLKDSEFGQLQRFVADNRGASFVLTTNIVLELFLNSNSDNVKITEFKYRPEGNKYWEAQLTMVNNV